MKKNKVGIKELELRRKRKDGVCRNSTSGLCCQDTSSFSLPNNKREPFHLDHCFGWRKHALLTLTAMAQGDPQRVGLTVDGTGTGTKHPGKHPQELVTKTSLVKLQESRLAEKDLDVMMTKLTRSQ